MEPQDRIMELEKKMDQKLEGVFDVLAKINEQLKEIKIGLFGNEQLNHLGVIKNQAYLQEQIKSLESKIEAIEKKNVEQDLNIGAKKSVWAKIWELSKWVLQTVVTGIMLYLVLKGQVGPDALIK